MKGLNLSQFKKLRSDSKSTTLKHPEGHQIVIAHHALSPSHKKQLAELPRHYADGGEVEEENRAPASIPAPEAAEVMGPVRPEQSVFEKVDKALSLPGEQDALARKKWEKGIAADQAALAAAPPVAQNGPAPASLAPPVMEAPVAPVQNSTPGLMQDLQGLRAAGNQFAKAAEAQGQMEFNVAQEQEKLLRASQAEYQKNFAEIDKEFKNVIHDVQNQHINPNHYMENMSTGKKVSTAIGLFLGGIGQGMVGGDNPAQKFLMDQIQRDVDAQKANLGKQETLLSANLKRFGNLHDATQITNAMQMGIYAAKIRGAESQVKGPEARLKAAQFATELDMKAAEIMDKQAQKQAAAAVMRMVNAPAKTEADYKNRLATLQAVDKDMYKDAQERYIPGVGVASKKPGDKDLELLTSSKQMQRGLTELQARAATIGTTVPGTKADAENKAKVANLKLEMKNAYQLGVLSQSDLDMLDNIVSDPGSLMTSNAIAKLEATKQGMAAKEKGVIAKLGITPFEGGGGMEGRTATGPGGQKIIMQNGKWVPYGR